MTIEPLSSVMSAQAQTIQRPAAGDAKTKVEYTDVSAQGAAAQPVDATVKIVEASQQRGNTGSDREKDGRRKPSNEQIKKAVEQLNKKMSNSEAVFGIHDATNRLTIKIVDKETKEVIKELPPEETLDMIAKVWELAGLLVDEKR